MQPKVNNKQAVKICTACRGAVKTEYIHPLLFIPICEDCHYHYGDGDKDFVVEDGNEIYCRACGEGKEELLLCDSCPKSFCSRCVGNMVGPAELRRIRSLHDRWHCFACSPLPIIDLCMKNGWNYHSKSAAASVNNDRKAIRRSAKVVHYDISNGREKFEIPVVNEVDKEPPPTDFTYICRPVVGSNVILAHDPSLLKCCSCTDNCRNTSTCECKIMSGAASYDSRGILLQERPGAIYECNYLCNCHASRCYNRVVGNGPQLRLEVFRCEDPTKGWGLRCKDDIDRGTFVADYLGQVIRESEADMIGLVSCDEYLYSVDFWGRKAATQLIRSLGLKDPIRKMQRNIDMDGSVLSREDIYHCLDDPELYRLLDESGAIERGFEKGRKLRENPLEFIRQQDIMYGNETDERKNDSSSISGGGVKVAGSNISVKQTRDNKVRADDKRVAGRKPSTLQHSDAPDISSRVGASRKPLSQKESWFNLQKISREKAMENSTTILQDRVIMETENNNETYVLDARWYGNVARFLNHSCSANLDIHIVFCDSHDIRMPRIAFMANQYIKANTELTYDYGYLPGNVEGKHRKCLCGSANCRITLY